MSMVVQHLYPHGGRLWELAPVKLNVMFQAHLKLICHRPVYRTITSAASFPTSA